MQFYENDRLPSEIMGTNQHRNLSQRMIFLRECMNIPDMRTYDKKLLIHSYDIVPPILESVFLVKQTRWDFVLLWQYIAAVPTNHSCSLLEHLFCYSPEALT